MKNIGNNKVAIGVIGLILGLVLGWLIGRDAVVVNAPDRNAEETANQETSMMVDVNGSQIQDALFKESMMSHESDSAILVNDQGAGSVATVASVETDVPAWVTVREDMNGVVGNILGASRVDAGSSNNIVINLLRPTEAGKTYRVVLFMDDGDRMFDHTKDAPIISDGVLVSQPFSVVAQ